MYHIVLGSMDRAGLLRGEEGLPRMQMAFL